MKLILELAYNGSKFFGWQIQPTHVTVQEVIQQKLHQITGENIEVVGCGRTDTGVHASQYFAHLEVESSLVEKISTTRLNAVLPESISILKISPISDDFHARYSARFRKYIYRIHTYKDPFNTDFSYYFNSISAEKLHLLNEVAAIIAKIENFESFAKSKSGLNHFKCTVFESNWICQDETHLEYHISANRFVRGMVRLCVGAALSYATQKINLSDIIEATQNRLQIPKSWSVPAHGLTLTEVKY
ncbi:MAG: tRNA pseudouridine(38-40) synthase TruA [Saprospiraceae bacterium]|nr:tRNA pseudouridine(38-40) synthase TruA [Saprospiraceae bacterium]